jgi:hypothetical protein
VKLLSAIAVTGALLSGCATFNPLPEGYSGATATLADSFIQEDGTKGQFYAIEAYNGNNINNAIIETREASYGHGLSLYARGAQRLIPAKPFRAKIVGTHQTGAPIHEITSRLAGTFFSVEGEIDFSPAPGGIYTVKGQLSKEISAVWIEDDATHLPVPGTVIEKR